VENETGTGGKIDIVVWLTESWEIYKKAWWPFTVTTVVVGVMVLLFQLVPLVGSLLVLGPLMIGFYLVIADIMAGREFNPARVFHGFRWFIPALLANSLITFFTMAGFMLLLIPGLVVGGWYILTYMFMADRGLDFWPAMEASRKVAFQDMVGMTIFYICLGAINGIGLVCLVVGLFVTVPLTTIATFIAYDRLVGCATLLNSAPDSEQAEGGESEEETGQ
jgi:uncharacterized membrane protein